jgi:hypothetical protein
MNIPFKNEPDYISTNNKIGNAGAGFNINKPNLTHKAQNYNNNETPNLTNMFIDNTNLYYHSNNPIDGKSYVNNKYLSSNGYSKRSFNPNSWSNFNLNDSYIQNTPSNSQTFAYNRNASTLDGGVKHQWSTYQTVNEAYNDLEQVVHKGEITPNDIVITDDQIAVDELLEEMNSGEETRQPQGRPGDGWIRGDSMNQYQRD